MTIPPEPCDVLKGRKTKMRSLTKVMFGAAAMLALAGFAALPAAAQAPDYAAGLVKPGTITIATTGNAPPITQVQPDGSISGFDIELCQKIASDLGLATEIVRVDFAATIPGLTAGRFDMICSSTARTKQRLDSPDLYMTVPTLQNFTTLLLRADDDAIKTVDDAKGKRIGVVRGGQEGQLLTDLFGSDVQVVSYPGIAEEILDLKNRRIDGVAMSFVNASYTAKSDAALKVLQPGFVKENVSPYDLALIVARSEEPLFKAVNAKIEELSASGYIDELKKKWILAD